MKLNPRKLNIALILIYLACMIFTAFTLFQLRDNLVYASQALSIADMRAAGSVLIKLNLTVGLTLLVGLAVVVILFRNRTEDVIYVEKKRLKDSEDEDGEDDEDVDGQLGISFLTEILKNEKDEQKIIDKSLNGICNKLEAGIGVIYTYEKSKEKKILNMKSSFALSLGESQTLSYELGEGLVGQVAKEKKGLIVDDIPEGYIKIVSGLGSSSPTHLLIEPIEKGKNIYGVIEIASFTPFDKTHETFVKKCVSKMVDKLGAKEATPKTASATKKADSADDKKETSKSKNKKA